MHQRDFILRIIEEIGTILVALRRRILGGTLAADEAERQLAGAADKVGLDIVVLRSLAGESLHLLAAPSGEVDPTRCWLMAEILYLDGLQARVEERDADARASLEKARLLFGMIAPGGGMLVGFPEGAERIAEIDEILG